MADGDEVDQLQRLDSQGFTVLDAIGPLPTTEGSPDEELPTTHSRPRPLVCIDGNVYWCKSNMRGGQVQEGLVAELVAGRLASRLGAGSACAIIRVTKEAIAGKADYDHLEGIVFGCLHHEGMIHVNKLSSLLGSETLKDSQLDLRSWAGVVGFQSWVGLGDGAQMMIDLNSGRVVSLDHADCFSNVSSSVPTVVANATLPGKQPSVLQDWKLFEDVITRIEAVTDDELLQMVSRIPINEGWSSPIDRRLAIWRWLSDRRNQMRDAVEGWVSEKAP